MNYSIDWDGPGEADDAVGMCDRCRANDGVGFNEDGDFLCEDCMFEEAVEQNMPAIVTGDEIE